ncbi:MAG: RdgB/HAM1 family non-canonical purine NTP pyrophosphatase, partial [Cryomorphaceae bacterium]
MQLIFASGNLNKIKELNDKTPKSISIISMRERGFQGEIEEPGATLEENAQIKAEFIHNLYHEDVFADDSGLEIEALNGAPGVHSARYAGPGCSFEDNNQKVLSEMHRITNRKARFRTVIHLIIDGNHHRFEGAIDGVIIPELRGNSGFGYDPIFQPLGEERTFAEMTLEEKN